MADSISTNINSPSNINHMHQNAVVVANIIEVVGSVIKNIANSDVSSTLSTQGVSTTLLGNIIANRIKERVLNTGA